MDPSPRTAEVKRSERGFLERTIALSDGVAAIAITLLVLPLVDLEAPDLTHGETVWDAIGENQNTLAAFAITFVVIAALWFAHARVFANLARADNTVAWSNIAYLLAIVVLPFAANWLQEDGFDGGVGTFYYLVLALASGSLGIITRHVNRHPDLLTDEARDDPRARTRRGFALSLFFLVGAALSWSFGAVAGWYMVLLWPVSVLHSRYETRRADAAAAKS